VRKRLEEAGKKGKKKKGFLTPERKKKLRVSQILLAAATDVQYLLTKMYSEATHDKSGRELEKPAEANGPGATEHALKTPGRMPRCRQDRRQRYIPSLFVYCSDEVNDTSLGQLEKIYNDLFNRMVVLEDEKYDINFVVSQKDSEAENSSDFRYFKNILSILDQ